VLTKQYLKAFLNISLDFAKKFSKFIEKLNPLL
jgi:hypothetical protein